jgi:toxin FitB
MNVVDSSGWLEYLTGSPNAAFFADPIQRLQELLVPSIAIYEVYRQGLHHRGRAIADQFVDAMTMGQVVALDVTVAVRAAELAEQHKLAMADAIILATAQAHGAVLWTQDADFDGLPGVQYRPKVKHTP